jgi:hypothetical protein
MRRDKDGAVDLTKLGKVSKPSATPKTGLFTGELLVSEDVKKVTVTLEQRWKPEA